MSEGLSTVLISVVVTGSIITVAVLAMMAVVIHWRSIASQNSWRNNNKRHKSIRDLRNCQTINMNIYHNNFQNSKLFGSKMASGKFGYINRFSAFESHMLAGYTLYKG